MKEEIKDRGILYRADDGFVYHTHDNEKGMLYLSDEVGNLIKLLYPESYDSWCRKKIGGDKKIHNI